MGTAFLIALVQYVIAPLVTAGIGLGVVWLKGKITNEKAKGVVERLGTLVATVVTAVEQIYVTAGTGAEKKAKALEYLKSYLGAKGLDELKKVLGIDDVDGYLSTLIEAQVFGLQETAPDPAPLPVNVEQEKAAGQAGSDASRNAGPKKPQ